MPTTASIRWGNSNDDAKIFACYVVGWPALRWMRRIMASIVPFAFASQKANHPAKSTFPLIIVAHNWRHTRVRVFNVRGPVLVPSPWVLGSSSFGTSCPANQDQPGGCCLAAAYSHVIVAFLFCSVLRKICRCCCNNLRIIFISPERCVYLGMSAGGDRPPNRIMHSPPSKGASCHESAPVSESGIVDIIGAVQVQ